MVRNTRSSPGFEIDAPADGADQELIEAWRNGDTNAMGALYSRHYGAALRLARRLARDSASAEDLVQDAFMQVFGYIRTGKGPERHFRAYLLTTLRHSHQRAAMAAQRIDLVDDDQLDAYLPTGSSIADAVDDAADAELIMAALRTLPSRWQQILWRTEVDELGLSAIATEFGVSTNCASALAYRARQGLAAAYLTCQINSGPIPLQCTPFAALLPRRLRSELSATKEAQVDKHVASCSRCSRMSDEMIDANTALLHRRRTVAA